MNLVIVESPAKAKTIEKYLGKEYKVIASMGHVVDLPKSELGIEIENNFKPKYIVTKKKSVKNIKDYFKKAKSLVIATDQDREGEAIGWHIALQLKAIDEKSFIKHKLLKRIVFTEITKEAIQKSLKNPKNIDMNLVNAQQARRVLDRLVGYKLSPLLWKKIRYGLSAGRVQSVAVRLIVQREEERNQFKSDEYWNIYLMLSKSTANDKIDVIFNLAEQKKESIKSNLLKFELVKIDEKKVKIKDIQQAKKIVSEIDQSNLHISSIKSKKVIRYPGPPFITSTLQQHASNKLGFSSKETMRIAQKLYEAGLITYMRTDSLNLALSSIQQVRKLIKEKYGEKYIPINPRFFKSKSKLAQEAHEAIRPTNFFQDIKKYKLSNRETNLYNLIWNKTVASQMSEAVVENSIVLIKQGRLEFKLIGQKIIFNGFLAVYPELISEVIIPNLKVGEKLYTHKIVSNQSFTQPPARYSEASLIKALEANGIGRPSTYASIISTILARRYVIKQDKYFIPTDTGIVVDRLLVDHFKDIVDTDFTASIEEDLDKIAEGKLVWEKVVGDFYNPFAIQLEQKDKKISRQDYTILGNSKIKCPLCKKQMVIKLGKYGKFLSCKNFPKCKGMLSIEGKGAEDLKKEAKSEKFLKIFKPSPKTKDDRDYVLKQGKYGRFWAHPDYPKVKEALPLEYKSNIFKKIYGEVPISKNGKKLLLKRGRFGEFWAHPDYPKNKEVIRINKKEINLKKKDLGII